MSETLAAPIAAPVVPLDDIQSGIFDPTEIAFEAHLFLRVGDPVGGRSFLRSVAPQITTQAQAGATPHPTMRLSIGFTWRGLAALGLDATTLASFPEEFRDGMAARASILGDNAASAPSQWAAPYGTADLHVWLLVQATTMPVLEARVANLLTQIAATSGISTVGSGERGALFGADHAPAKEHFGFNDLLSQPGVEGVGQPVQPGQGTLQDDGTWKPIPVGCFLLGYPDGYGQTEDRPSNAEIRQNGTYMVLRKLEQHVPAFRAYVKETADLLGIDEEFCAAKFVGRWRSGAALALAPDRDDPSILDDPSKSDAFAFGGDEDGSVVPHFAHIRRANPRDALGKRERALVDVTNHRIIRRAAPYGPYLVEGAPDDGNARGILFRAFNASILDQFELIQSKWINNGNEAHGLSNDRDPFVGTTESVGPTERQVGSSFTIPHPDGSCPTRYNLPLFVTVKGGDYFFVPGMKALITLAQEPPLKAPNHAPKMDPANFVATYQAVSAQTNISPLQLRQEQIGVVFGAQDNLVALGNSLRRNDATKVFSTPIAVLLSTYPDIVEAFALDDVFSVSGYNDRMTELAGAFMLGMDPGPAYERESSIMRLVAPSSELGALARWIEGFASSAVETATAHGPSFDLVSTVANRVPLGFISHYFGIPGPDDATFMTWLRASALYIFEFWATQSPPIKDAATSTALQFGAYLQSAIDTRLSALLADSPTVPDDVLTRMLRLLGPDPTKLPPNPAVALDKYTIRRNLAGFTIGCAVPPSGTIAFAMQYLLQPQNASALAMTRAAAMADDDDLLTQCMLEAARLAAPSPPSLFRTSTADYVMGRGTPRATLIPKGSVVALYPAVAMTDPDFVDDPLTFRPGRPAYNYVMFGEGRHTCFGTAIGTMLLAYSGKALLRLNGLHEVAPMKSGTGVPNQFYPGTYEVSTSG